MNDKSHLKEGQEMKNGFVERTSSKKGLVNQHNVLGVGDAEA